MNANCQDLKNRNVKSTNTQSHTQILYLNFSQVQYLLYHRHIFFWNLLLDGPKKIEKPVFQHNLWQQRKTLRNM